MFGSILRIALPLVAQRGLIATFANIRRQAAVLLAAAGLLAGGFVFVLVAVHALLLQEGFSPPAAAGLIAAVLIGLALLVLAANAYRHKRPSRSSGQFRTSLASSDASGTVAAVEEQAGKLMKNIGPLTLLAAVFAIGLTAGRRK